MKKQSVQISVPEPCHENWEEMTAVERGRFCNSCQKVVTDFTMMEDAEIIRNFQEGKNLCGRFNNKQLNRALQMPVESPRYFISSFYKRLAASLLFFSAFSNTTFAQNIKVKTTQNEKEKQESGSNTFIWIKGDLLDAISDSQLQKVSIILSVDTCKFITQTDTSGRFFFKISNRYKDKIAKVSVENIPSVFEEFVLNKDRVEILLSRQYGGLKIGGAKDYSTVGLWIAGHPDENLTPPKPKRSFWHRLTHPFKKRNRSEF